MAPKKRQSSRPRRTAMAVMPDERKKWVTTSDDQYILYVNPDDGDPDTERGPSAVVTMIRNMRPYSIDLTRFTTAELNAVEQFFKEAFETARPLVEERDRHAQADYAAGNGAQFRLYRRLPLVVGLSGDGREHVEGVLFRPQPVSARLGDGYDPGRGVRGDGDGVADDEADRKEPRGTQDIKPPTDFTEEVRGGDVW